jgi:hypothetical protein
MKPFIDFNTRKRKEATSFLSQTLFKARINSTFGKTMENVRLRKKVELVMDKLKVKKVDCKTTPRTIQNYQ